MRPAKSMVSPNDVEEAKALTYCSNISNKHFIINPIGVEYMTNKICLVKHKYLVL